MPFPEYVERTVAPVAGATSTRSPPSRAVGSGLACRRGWLTLRATRLPFLSATLIPVAVGLAIAAAQGFFDPFTALLTIIGASAAHLALNVANDVFDARQGADDANVRPTQFSGGSRVIQYGLVSLRGMSAISLACYAVAIVIGLVLLVTSWSLRCSSIGILGLVLSIEYTAPPLKLVYRGLGELTTAIGFGPLMLVGAYVVQSGGTVSVEALAGVGPDRDPRGARSCTSTRSPTAWATRASASERSRSACRAQRSSVVTRSGVVVAFGSIVVGVVAGRAAGAGAGRPGGRALCRAG